MTPTEGLGVCVTYKESNIQRNVTASYERERELRKNWVNKYIIKKKIITPPLCHGSRSPLEKTILLADLISKTEYKNI